MQPWAQAVLRRIGLLTPTLPSPTRRLFGWFAPGIMLDLRKKMVRAEEEEDVLQLQTMLAILRYTSLDTMEALYWLARQSRIYQTAIYFAYHEYPSDPELALNRLRDKSSLPEFQ